MKISPSSNTNPFTYKIKNLDPSTSYNVKIVRTKIGSVEGSSSASGEVVEFIGTFTTKTLGM